jgi:hypothetical protein
MVFADCLGLHVQNEIIAILRRVYALTEDDCQLCRQWKNFFRT